MDERKYPPFALLTLANEYRAGGIDALNAAIERMPQDQLSGIFTWLCNIGSDLRVLSSFRQAARYAALEIVEGHGFDHLGVKVLRAVETRFGGYKQAR